MRREVVKYDFKTFGQDIKTSKKVNGHRYIFQKVI